MFKMAFLATLGYYCAKTIVVLFGECCKSLGKRLEDLEKKTKASGAPQPKEVKKTGRIVVSGFGREL